MKSIFGYRYPLYMKSLIRIFSLCTLLFVVGCSNSGGPTIDTSTEESTQRSVEQILESLPQDKKNEFEQALAAILFSHIGSALSNPTPENNEKIEAELRKQLHGKNADEIIATAKALNK